MKNDVFNQEQKWKIESDGDRKRRRVEDYSEGRPGQLLLINVIVLNYWPNGPFRIA